jgi:hypothetical protein
VRTTREHHYKGPAEVWVDGAQRFEADVHMTKRESVEESETLVGSESVPLSTTWDGRFHGLAQEDLRTLLAIGEFELRLRRTVARVGPCCPTAGTSPTFRVSASRRSD